jgi:hypothetical protein
LKLQKIHSCNYNSGGIAVVSTAVFGVPPNTLSAWRADFCGHFDKTTSLFSGITNTVE